MSGPLKNARHEKFAQQLAKGITTDDAYVAAGYTHNRGNAARLKANESVLARLGELQARTAEKATTTAADIARQLDEDRAFARKLKQSSAAVSATMGKAKVLGLLFEQTKQYYDFSKLTDEEAEQLESLLAKCQPS
jgi:hypothetical protein